VDSRKAVVEGLRVGVLQKLEVNLTRSNWVSVSDSVTVTGVTELLAPTSSSISTNIAPREYQDLPVFSAVAFRTPYGLAALLPGVNNTKYGLPHQRRPGNSRELQVDACRSPWPNGKATAAASRFLRYHPGISIITNNFAAEFGRSGGGIESYTVKSGLTSFTASFTNTPAMTPSTRAPSTPPKPASTNSTISAATWAARNHPKVYNGRNKTFFFFHNSYTGRPTPYNSYLSSVPRRDEERGFHRVPGYQGRCDSHRDPPAPEPAPTVHWVRDPFVGNIIPKSRFSKVATNVQAYFPEPTRAGDFSNYDSYDPGRQPPDRFHRKLDHKLQCQHKLGFSVVTTIWPNNWSPKGGGLPIPQREMNTYLDSWVLRASMTGW